MKHLNIFSSLLFLSINARAIDLKTNLEVKELDNVRVENSLNRKINRANYLPQLSLESGLEAKRKHPNTESESGPYLYLKLKQNLFSGGKNYYESKNLNLENERLKILAQIKERDLKLESIRLLSEIETNEKKLELLKHELNENQKLKSMVARKIAAGLSPQSETLEFETKELSINDKILILNHDLSEQKEALLSTYSYQYSLEQLKRELDIRSQEIKSSPAVPLEVKLNQLNLKKNEILVSKSKSEYLPEIDLEAKAGHITAANDYALSKTSEYQVAVNFSFPLFSGGSTYYEVQSSKNTYQLTKNRNEVESITMKNRFELDLKKQQLIKEQIKIAKLNEAKNLKHFELIQAEFKRGIKEGGDLLSALSELTESQEKLLELNHELNIIESKLKLFY